MKCKKCGNELIQYQNVDNIEYICPICDETPATQIENLIEYDTNSYVIKISAVSCYSKELLKEVSKICSCNILEAKSILEKEGKKFEPMDALETRVLKDKLDSKGISYIITPKFNW